MKSKDIFVAHPPQQILTKSHQPLLIVKSFFPFDLFPDQLIINSIEVIFIYNMFFWSSYETSMSIDNIGDLILTHGPFFATLTITPTSTLKDQPIHIRWLTKAKAKKAHDLLQGLVMLRKEKADIASLLSEENGIEEIMKIGKVGE